MTKACVKNHNGSPTIFIDGKPYAPMMATIRTNNRTEMIIDKEYYRQLGLAGIRVFFLICDTEWLKPGAFAQFCEEAEILLEAVPEAWIIPRIGLHPPIDWIEQHPDECVTFNDGSRRSCLLYTESYQADIPAMYSLCSSVWREDAGKALLDTIRKMRELPYANRIVGFFLAAGGTSEWYYISRDVNEDGTYGDFSEAFRREYEAYLRDTYQDVETLRKAWNDPEATFEHPRIPTAEELYCETGLDWDNANPPRLYSTSPAPAAPNRKGIIGSFLDCDCARHVSDYFRARHLGTANSVIYFARCIKEFSEDLLVGAFYGSCGCTSLYKGGTAAGTLRILDSGYVDFLAAPGVYQNRQPGGFTGQREMNDSFRLRNRIFIVEEDTRTHAENAFYANHAGMFTMDDTLNVMKRDFGRNIGDDLQAWWFDQHMGGGRYKFPEVYALIRRQQEIANEFYASNRTKPHEIAFIYDEESIHVVTEQTTRECVEHMRNYEISLIGTACDQYFHNDMENPSMPDYKLYIFSNTFQLTDHEREVIRRKLAKNHAVALFLYGNGYINPDRTPQMSVDYISELTGIQMREQYTIQTPKFRMEKTCTHPAFVGIDRGNVYGWLSRKMVRNTRPAETYEATYICPVFYAEDEESVTGAKFCIGGYPAVSLKENEDFTAVYCGAKYVREDFIRAIAKYAGCHIYSDSDDVVYVGSHYITFHASTSGLKTIRFPESCSPFELYEQVYYGHNVKEISFELLQGETKMFRF